MIALDLCRQHYQVLFIIYLKFSSKSAEYVKREKLNQYGILSGLKVIKHIANSTNLKKGQLEPINGLIKKF